MPSRTKPVITIAGASSKQGRSVARTLLQSGRYRVRALTRRIDSPEAQRLAEQGAELIAVPLEVGHKGEFVNAFAGAWWSMGITDLTVIWSGVDESTRTA